MQSKLKTTSTLTLFGKGIETDATNLTTLTKISELKKCEFCAVLVLLLFDI